MKEQTVNSLFIDVDNKTNANKVFRRLKKLKNVLSISKPENYYFGGIQHECIIRLETHMSESELDSYLYKFNLPYIGCGIDTRALSAECAE